MPLENSLNVSPYFDDYAQSKEFYRILFKPGVAVQTRELNQLQSIIQNQIERFGDHVFKSGTIISGVNFTYLPTYSFIKITDEQVDGQPSLPSAYVDYFLKSNLNLTARVLNYEDGLESKSPDLKTLFLQYTNSSEPDEANSDAVYTTFVADQQLTVFSKDYPIFKVTVDYSGKGFSNSDTVVVLSSIVLANVTGTFAVNDVILGSTSGARAIVKEVDTTSISGSTVLRVQPRDTDLTTSGTNATAWTLQAGETITNAAKTAQISTLVGSNAAAYIVTDSQGIITTVTLSSGGLDYTVLPTVTVKTSNTTAPVSTLTLTPQNYKSKIVVGNSSVTPTGTGYAFGVSEGIIYQKGHFLKVEPQVIVVDKYTTTPNNIAVGFKTVETIIDANDDTTLFDNASNTTNFSAPGADRLKLTPVLTTMSLSNAASNVDFFSLAEWKEGYPYKENRVTIYNNLADEFARRTREAQGNFVVDSFLVGTRDVATNTTVNTDITKINTVIDPGLAYIGGYRVQTLYNNYLDVDRSATYTSLTNQSTTASYGNYVKVKELAGLFNVTNGATVDIYNVAQTFLTNNTPSTTIAAPSGGSTVKIGTARIRSLVVDSGVPGAAGCVYRMYLFDVTMVKGYSFREARSIHYDGDTDAICDVVTTTDTTTGTQIAVLNDVNLDKMLFSVGQPAVKAIDNFTYTYKAIQSPLEIATSGQFDVTLTGDSLTYPYTASAALSETQKKDFVIVPLENGTTANVSGAVTMYANTLLAINTSTLHVGDYLNVVNSTANVIRQVGSIANATHLNLTTNGTAMTGNAAIYFPALFPIGLEGRTDRAVTINSTKKTASIDLFSGTATTLAAAIDCAVMYNVTDTDASATAKTVRRDVFVKINTATNAANNVGPWYLGVPQVFRLKKVYMGDASTVNTSSTDVTKYFYVDAGDDENAYRSARLVLNTNSGLTVNNTVYMLVKFDAFTATSPGVFTVQSYPIDDTKKLSGSSSTINTLEIPETVTKKGVYYDLRDTIDFRPYGANTANLATVVASANTDPANTFAIASGTLKFPVPDSVITFDADYYNARTDRVIVKKDSSFAVIKGSSALTKPVAPAEPADSVTLAILTVPPYPSLPAAMNSDQIEFATRRVGGDIGSVDRRITRYRVSDKIRSGDNNYQPRRFTMADIGSLERRLTNVENLTLLTQVESAIKDKVIPSGITPTTSRFKHGFLVEPFEDYTKVDVGHREFAATIDQKLGFLKPQTTQINFESQFDRSHANTSAAIVGGDTLMLPFTEEALINQNVKSGVVGSDGQQITFVGEGTITPASFSIQGRGEVINTPDPVPVIYGDAGGSTGGDTGSTGGGGCFLTTATVHSLGLGDDCVELMLARYLRDSHMTSERDVAAKYFYTKFGPVIVQRKTEWRDFYDDVIAPVTELVKRGDNQEAVLLYKAATLKLIDEHASRYEDKELMSEVFDKRLAPSMSSLPYVVKYGAVKTFIKYKLLKHNISNVLRK